MHKGQQLTLLGAIGLVLGALLPWVKATTVLGSISKAGYEGDGLITGAIGLILLIGTLLNKGKAGKRYSVASSIFGVIVLVIVGFDYLNVAGAVSDVQDMPGVVDASVGAGLYLTLLAAFLVLVGGWQRVPGPGNIANPASSSASLMSESSNDPERQEK